MEEMLQVSHWSQSVKLKCCFYSRCTLTSDLKEGCAQACCAVFSPQTHALQRQTQTKSFLQEVCIFPIQPWWTQLGPSKQSKLFPHLKHGLWPYKCGTEECSYCGLDFLCYKHWCSGDESKGMKRSCYPFQMAVFCVFPAYISNIRKVTSW